MAEGRGPRYDPHGDRLCLRCARYVAPAEFKAATKGYKGLGAWCRRCHALAPYGISSLDYENMLSAQGGKCAIPTCGASRCPTGKSFAVDHCHKTGKIRGLLCRDCNVALGYAKDRPDTLRALANYLEAHYG